MLPALTPLHATPGPLPPHWVVLVVGVAALSVTILLGVALADRLLVRFGV